MPGSLVHRLRTQYRDYVLMAWPLFDLAADGSRTNPVLPEESEGMPGSLVHRLRTQYRDYVLMAWPLFDLAAFCWPARSWTPVRQAARRCPCVSMNIDGAAQCFWKSG